MTLGLLFAHAGGFSWDEALLVLAPILVVGALLFVANRRASAHQLDHDAPAPDATDDERRPAPSAGTAESPGPTPDDMP